MSSGGQAKLSLLFLSQTLPFPPDSGVKVRSYNLLSQLAVEYNITALCFYRRASTSAADLERATEQLAPVARIEVFPIEQEHDVVRRVWDHLRSVASGSVYTRFVYSSSAYRKRLERLLGEREWGCVYADSLDLSTFFPMLASVPLVCGHHDAQSVLLSRRAGFEHSMWRRWYVQRQALLMHQEEARWCGRVKGNIVVSDLDQSALQSAAPDGRFAVVPNGVDTRFYTPREEAHDGGIVFVGAADWFPNLDAMNHLGEDILPPLRKLAPDVGVRWIGRVSDPVRARMSAQYGIETVGHLPDLRQDLGRALCVVVPLRIGSGSRVKILEAWGMGKAVVSSSLGCEGLPSKPEENILIRDNPEDFARAVYSVVRDPALRRMLGSCARATVERDCDWNNIGTTLRTSLAGFLDGAPR